MGYPNSPQQQWNNIHHPQLASECWISIWIFAFHPRIQKTALESTTPASYWNVENPLKALNCFEILGFLSFAIDGIAKEKDF